jgi:hypothetical protein
MLLAPYSCWPPPLLLESLLLLAFLMLMASLLFLKSSLLMSFLLLLTWAISGIPAAAGVFAAAKWHSCCCWLLSFHKRPCCSSWISLTMLASLLLLPFLMKMASLLFLKSSLLMWAVSGIPAAAGVFAVAEWHSCCCWLLSFQKRFLLLLIVDIPDVVSVPAIVAVLLLLASLLLLAFPSCGPCPLAC